MKRTIADYCGLKSAKPDDGRGLPPYKESVSESVSSKPDDGLWETITIYPGRSFQRVGTVTADDGTLLGILIEQSNGSFKRLKCVPRWLRPGMRRKQAKTLVAVDCEARAIRIPRRKR